MADTQNTTTDSNKPAPKLGGLFLTVFLDIAGFSLIFTVIPELLAYYIPGLKTVDIGSAGSDWASSLFLDFSQNYLEPLAAASQWSGQGVGLATLTLLGGFMAGLYSLLQFFSAPFWGGVSDRIGRKKTLQITIALNALSYFVWFLAPSFSWFLLSRILAGFFAGNISVASAMVADMTETKDRTKGMGFIGMAIGFGFILGPVMGNVFYHWLELHQASVFFHPFSGIAIVAVILNLVNLVQLTKKLPDLPPSNPAARRTWLMLEIFRLEKNKDYDRGFLPALIIQLIYLTFFVAFEFTLPFFFGWELGFTPVERGMLFGYVGLVLALTQGGLSRRLSGKVSEKKQLLAGFVLFVVAFALYTKGSTAGGNTVICLIAVGIIAIAAGIVSPALSALASLTFSDQRQGLGLGMFRSVGALARVVGPFIGSMIYLIGGPFVLFSYCAALSILVIFLLIALPEGEYNTAAHGE